MLVGLFKHDNFFATEFSAKEKDTCFSAQPKYGVYVSISDRRIAHVVSRHVLWVAAVGSIMHFEQSPSACVCIEVSNPKAKAIPLPLAFSKLGIHRFFSNKEHRQVRHA